MSTTHDDLRELADQIHLLRSALLNSCTAALTDGERAPGHLHEACAAVVEAAQALARVREILEALIAAERNTADILQFRRGPNDAIH